MRHPDPGAQSNFEQIQRSLGEVSDPAVPSTTLLEFQDFASPALSLTASAEED
jgi:hypothetical protein